MEIPAVCRRTRGATVGTMRARRLAMGLLGLALVTAGVVAWRWRAGAARPRQPGPATATSSAATTPRHGETPSPPPPAPPAAGAPAPPLRRLAPAERSALQLRLATARAARAAGQPRTPPPATAPAPLPSQLDPDALLAGVMPILPLLQECYASASAQRPLPGGKLSVTMRLLGEPEVGTLVDDATIGGDPALLADAELTECLRETMLSIELPPTAEGTETTMKIAVALGQ